MRTRNITPENEIEFLERFFESHRLPRFARFIGRLAVRETHSLERRFYDEMTSGFTEALAGVVRTEYDFGVMGGKLVADDGETFESMMLRARLAAYEVAASDPRMNFVVDRFNAEIGELHEQEQMITGQGGHNTIITFSPYTEELIDQPELLKRGYQKPQFRRSMIRISHWDGARMHIFTRSLDNSTMSLLAQTAHVSLGYDFDSHDSLGMLSERLKGNYDLAEVRRIADTICSDFDTVLSGDDGRIYTQGRDQATGNDVFEFVTSHSKVMTHLIAESTLHARTAKTYKEFRSLLDGSMHRHLALMEQLLEGREVALGSIGDAAHSAGQIASSEGRSYDMCGYVVADPNMSKNSPLGTMTGLESLMAYAGVRIQCPNSSCKEFVVVDTKHLADGILHCKACFHTVDVCGDTAKADRVRKEAIQKRKKDLEKQRMQKKRLAEKQKARLKQRQLIS